MGTSDGIKDGSAWSRRLKCFEAESAPVASFTSASFTSAPVTMTAATNKRPIAFMAVEVDRSILLLSF